MHQRIRDLREDSDLKQKELARFLSIAQTTYSGYERGRVNIPIPILKHMATLYDTSIDYLLGLTDEKKPYPRR